jgi:sulfite reductase beta subunit-like hemoprotein
MGGGRARGPQGRRGTVTRAVASDRCPGVLRLHEAADGGLARVRLPGGRIDARGLRGIGDVAELGNGVIELTSRASLQVRGLDTEAGEQCAAVLAAAGLLPSTTHERARNVLASPVAGRHPRSLTSTDDLVVELDHAICGTAELEALTGRFLFAVDDGSGLLGSHVPDVAVVASTSESFAIVEKGVASSTGVGRPDAIGRALDAARAMMRADPSEPPAGARRLGEPDGLSLGRLAQTDGRVALTMLPRLARLDVSTVRRLAELVDEHRTDVRCSVQRTLTLPDLEPRVVETVEGGLRALGLVDDPASGWHGLSACSGLGACVRARHDVRAEAAGRAGERRADDPLEHWAACERRCGRPSGAHIAYTATSAGIEREVVQ